MRLLLRSRGVHDLLPGSETDGLPKRTRGATTVANLLLLDRPFGVPRTVGSSLVGAHEDYSDNADLAPGSVGAVADVSGPLANYALASRGLARLTPGEGFEVAAAASSAFPVLRRLELLDGAVGDAVRMLCTFVQTPQLWFANFVLRARPLSSCVISTGARLAHAAC
jgi:hypothetical protein